MQLTNEKKATEANEACDPTLTMTYVDVRLVQLRVDSPQPCRSKLALPIGNFMLCHCGLALLLYIQWDHI